MILRGALLLAFSLCYLALPAQYPERSYSGSWGRTMWTYHFFGDGNYERSSSGHFGDVRFSGNYVVRNDTLHLLSGYNASSGTLNEFYLLHEDSMLVDLGNFYDYAPSAAGRFHMSRKRYDLMPAQPLIPEMLPGTDSVARSLHGKKIQISGSWKLDSTFVHKVYTNDRMRYNSFGTEYLLHSDGTFRISEPGQVLVLCRWSLNEDEEGSWILLHDDTQPGQAAYSERLLLLFTDSKRAMLRGGSGQGSYTYYLSRH